jgi:EF hand domain-containing protein
MMNRLALLTLAALGTITLAACDTATPPVGGNGAQSRQSPGQAPGQVAQAPTSTLPSFDSADTNKDGAITRQEALPIAGLEFSQADTNADSLLSRQEYASAMQPQPRPRG